jgi:hypothetical protein
MTEWLGHVIRMDQTVVDRKISGSCKTEEKWDGPDEEG